MSHKTLIFIPTYRECGNLKLLIPEIRDKLPEADVLIVDDFSGDGTEEYLSGLASKDGKIRYIIRRTERGRGHAGKDGFLYAVKNGYDIIVEMDGDMSHNPDFIRPMIDFLETKKADVVLGSRFVKGGRDNQRGFVRKAVSAFARFYLNFVLSLNVLDPTSGFRVFRTALLSKFADRIRSKDPFIVTETLYYSRREKAKIAEYPIEFFKRQEGESKLRPWTLILYLFRALLLRMGLQPSGSPVKGEGE